jgi:hypothetical protein
MAVTCGIYPEYKVDKTVFIAELINYASQLWGHYTPECSRKLIGFKLINDAVLKLG